jgi:hypothetical protein
MKLVTSKFLTSQANLVLNFSALNLVMGAAPLTPVARLCQYSWALLPIGVSAPIPVTTTLRKFMQYFSCPGQGEIIFKCKIELI